MKSVGLATYFGHNYGGCLQAYALQNVINELGYGCEIIDHDQYLEFKQDKKRITRNLKTIAKSIENRYIHHYKFKDHKKNRADRFDSFIKEYLTFSTTKYYSFKQLKKECTNYDMYVCGSDQIWNPVFKGNKNSRFTFLDFVPEGKKRIAYAPSIGVSEIPEVCKDEMSDLLEKMTHLSVRENQGAEIIQKLTGLEAKVVLDPILLWKADRWKKEVDKVKIKDFDMREPYILCYFFGDLPYVSEFIDNINKATGIRVVVLPFNNREYKSDYLKMFDCGPLEFAALINNAKLVCTDSFHATIFSINLKTPFYSLLRQDPNNKESMNSRIYNILEMLGLSDRLVAPATEFPKTNFFQVDFNKAQEILDQQRISSINYLRAALEE